jgi:Flp pilus assembly protein CpaB
MGAFSLRRRIPRSAALWFVLAGVCAVTAFVLVRDLAARARSAGPTPTIAVVVAASDLPAGHELGTDDVELVEIPSPAPPAAVVDPSDVVGAVTVTPFRAGETVSMTRLATRGGPLVVEVPPGMLGVTLGVEALPDGLQPGDRIDVLATYTSARPYTTTVATDVPVLDMPGVGGGLAAAGTSGSRILVIASPEIARQLVQANATGTLAVAVRGYEPLPVATEVGG